MWRDSIVEAVREAREAYAKQFNYDIQAIYRGLKEQEAKSCRKTVALPPRPTESIEGFSAGQQ